MANYNLTNQTISSSFEQLLQKDTDTGNLVDGLGNNIDSLDIDGTVSSSFIGDGSGLTNLPTQTLPSGLVSGSEQIDYPLISNIPSGIISSSEQLPSGLVSGSSQVSYPELSNIPSGIVSSSEQLPSGLVSGSSQVSYIGLSNIPSGIISSSEQLPSGLVSGSSQVIDILVPLNSYTSSNDTKWSNLGTQSGSFVTEDETGSFAKTDEDNTFTGNQSFNDITVSGTGSFAHINYVTGSATIIGDAFVVLNADTPTQRYAGIKVFDSGSNSTASLEWDGDVDSWMVIDEERNSAYLLSGPTGSLGNETSLTDNTIPKSGVGNQILDSNITDDGTTISLGNNVKVDSDLTLTNSSKVEVELGSSVNFYEDGNSLSTSGLRFHSGSDSTGTKWINIQPEPGGEGRLAIASFPENNHFMFFDPKDSQPDNQRLYIESIIEGGNRGGVVRIGQGLEVTGSFTNEGDATIVGNTIIEGTSAIPGTTFQARDGNGIPRITVNNATLSGILSEDVNLNGNTTVGGNITIAGNGTQTGFTTQTFDAPGTNGENAFINVNNAVVQGRNYNRVFQGMADYPGFGKQFEDYFSIEYYDSFGYNFGSEFAINGSGATIQTVPSGSGYNGRATISTVDNYNGTADININARNGGINLTGTTTIDGSVLTNVDTLTIASTTASIDFSQTSLFELTLGSGVDTHIVASNVGAGQTINVLITQDATTAGTVSFSSDFLQPSGSEYTPTTTLGGQDIITLMTYNDTSKIYVASVNTFE